MCDVCRLVDFFVFKQKTAYEMRISDWSLDVCSSDLYGFLETPYRKVVNGKVTDEVEFLSAIEENEYVIAQANAPQDEKGNLTAQFVACRQQGENLLKPPSEIHFMDVSPMQTVSVAAALVPFLEPDDEIGRAHVSTPVHNAHT